MASLEPKLVSVAANARALVKPCTLLEPCARIEAQFDLTTGRQSTKVSMFEMISNLSIKNGLQSKKAFSISMHAQKRGQGFDTVFFFQMA